MSDAWTLRKADGAHFGPVALDTLVQWAADGRIAPEDQVSLVGSAWEPAPSRPELAMDWIVQLASGDVLGPVHLLALREPWRAGQIPPRARVVRRSTGESFDAADALVQAMLERGEQLEDRLAQLSVRVSELAETAAHAPAPAPDEAAPRTDPTKRFKDLETTKDLLEREVRRLTRLFEDERQARAELQAEHETLARQAREEQLSARREIEVLRKETRGTHAPEEPAAPGPEGALDTASLKDMVRRLSRNYHAMAEQAEHNAEALRQSQERVAELERQSAEGEAQQALASARAEVEAERTRYAELEQTHREILRQFRDLNDRYVRAAQPPPSRPG